MVWGWCGVEWRWCRSTVKIGHYVYWNSIGGFKHLLRIHDNNIKYLYKTI